MFYTVGKLFTTNFYHNPMFVVGAGRSGTSVLIEAISKHHQVYSLVGESHFIAWVGNLVYPFEFGDNVEYYDTCVRVHKRYLYDQYRQLVFESEMGRYFGLKTLFKSFMRSPGAYLKKKSWSAKVNPDYDQFRGLLKLYPNLKIVHIVRNGTDVIRSRSKFSSFRHQPFESHCNIWANLIKKYSYLNDAPQAVQVRHETLVAEPEAVFREIYAFCGLSYDASSANFVGSNVIHPLDKPTQHNIDTRQTFKKRPPAYENWTGEQKDTFKRICGDAMRQLVYEMPF